MCYILIEHRASDLVWRLCHSPPPWGCSKTHTTQLRLRCTCWFSVASLTPRGRLCFIRLWGADAPPQALSLHPLLLLPLSQLLSFPTACMKKWKGNQLWWITEASFGSKGSWAEFSNHMASSERMGFSSRRARRVQWRQQWPCPSHRPGNLFVLCLSSWTHIVHTCVREHVICTHIWTMYTRPCTHICMFVCICHLRACMCVHVCICVCVCTCICMVMHILCSIRMFVCVCTYVCLCVHVSTGVYMCLYMCVCVCVCVCGVHVCVARLCLTLGNRVDYSPPISSPGILQARILEWVAISSSRGSSWPRDQTHVPCVSCIVGGFFTAVPLGKPFVNLVSKHLSQSFLNFFMDINF